MEMRSQLAVTISLAIGAEASFVARSIDTDRKHLTEMLRAASAHKGSALIEIYQNCPIFNDDAYQVLKDGETKGASLLQMVHGQPIKSETHGVIMENGSMKVVELSSVSESDLIVHHANNPDPSYAFALSRLSSSELDHVPIGVFRDYARPEYSNLVNQQISDEIANHGAGELAALLGSGDTWNVED